MWRFSVGVCFRKDGCKCSAVPLEKDTLVVVKVDISHLCSFSPFSSNG